MLNQAYQRGVAAAFEKLGIDLKGAREAYERLKKHMVKRRLFVSPAGTPTTDRFEGAQYRGPLTRHDNKKIYTRGDTAHMYAKKLTKPDDQELFNRLLILHEGSERSSVMNRHKFDNWSNAHHDPTVLLHENNMLATLPETHREVKKQLQRLRTLDEGVQWLKEFLPAPYGEKRYNRHEIKSIAEKIREKYPPPKRM